MADTPAGLPTSAKTPSDLFGSDLGGTPRIKDHMKSSIFAAPEPINKPRRAQTMDSHNRLFGEPDRQAAAPRDRMRSSVPIGNGGSELAKVQESAKNGGGGGDRPPSREVNGNSVRENGNGMNGSAAIKAAANGNLNGTNGSAKNGGATETTDGRAASRGGNPVTMEGYGNGQHVATPIKNRVPPGGFSSGLW